MINDLLSRCDFEKRAPDFAPLLARLAEREPATIAVAHHHRRELPRGRRRPARRARRAAAEPKQVPVLGITGTGGAGKSSLVDELVRRFLADSDDKTIAVLSVDPSKRKSGGALLGDRIRMNAIDDPRVYMRSLATRQSNLALSKHVRRVDRGLPGGRLRSHRRRDLGHRPVGHRDHRARRRLALLDDRRVRRGDAAREDRHARLRRRHRDQQVRQARLARRAARREEAVAAQPQRLRDRRRRRPGLRHDRLAVQRSGDEPALPDDHGRRREEDRRAARDRAWRSRPA